MKIQLLILAGALLLTPARANLIPDDFPWNPINVDYNGETCIYDYQPQDMIPATTLRLGKGGYSSMNSLIRSAHRHRLPEPIRVIVAPGVYRNSWDLVFDFDGEITCPSNNCIFKNNSQNQPAIKAANIILRNLTFIGGNTGLFFRPNNQGGRKDIINCKFCNSLRDDGLSIRDSGDFYIYKSEASYNKQDGFDHHAPKQLRGLTRVIELDSVCRETGYIKKSSNCSTAHEDVIVIRVNGFYDKAKDRTVHDIQDSRTLMINNYVGDSRRHGKFKGAQFYGNAQAIVIGKRVLEQDINFYGSGEFRKEEIK